jgi:hypothetical protein
MVGLWVTSTSLHAGQEVIETGTGREVDDDLAGEPYDRVSCGFGSGDDVGPTNPVEPATAMRMVTLSIVNGR